MASNDPQGLLEGLEQANQEVSGSGLAAGVTAGSIIENIINWLLGISAVVATAVIIWGGLMYILSLGEEDRAKKAKNIILYGIIGLLIVGGSFLIIELVQQILTGNGAGNN